MAEVVRQIKLPDGTVQSIKVDDSWDKATIKQKLTEKGIIKAPEPTWVDSAVDMAKQIVTGPARAALEVNQAATEWMGKTTVGLGTMLFGTPEQRAQGEQLIDNFAKAHKEAYEQKLWQPETTEGKVAGEFSKFISGFVPIFKATKGLQTANKFGKLVHAYAAGAITDATVFDPQESRLSNTLIKYDNPVFNNAVTQYLAASPEDSASEGRFKSVLEGLLLGGTIDLGIKGAKSMTPEMFKKAVSEKAQWMADMLKPMRKMMQTPESPWTHELRKDAGLTELKALPAPKAEIIVTPDGVARETTGEELSAAIVQRQRDDFLMRNKAIGLGDEPLPPVSPKESAQARRTTGPLLHATELESSMIKKAQEEAAWDNHTVEAWLDKHQADLIEKSVTPKKGFRGTTGIQVPKGQRGSIDPDLLLGAFSKARAIYKSSASPKEFTDRLVKELGENYAPVAQYLYHVSRTIEEGTAPEITQQAAKLDKKYAGSINLERMDTGDQIKSWLDSQVGQYEKVVKSADEIERAARYAGMSYDEVLRLSKSVTGLESRILAARDTLVRSAEEIYTALPAMKGASDEQLQQFMTKLQKHVQLTDAIQNISSTAGRALFAHKIPSEGAGRAEALQAFIAKAGGRDKINDLLDMMLVAGPENISSLGKKALRDPTIGDAFSEYYINMLLSGLQTHFTNTLSTGVAGMWTIAERATAAGFGLLRGGADKVSPSEAIGYARGYLSNGRNALLAMGKTFVADDAIIRSGTGEIQDAIGKIELDRHHAFKAKTFGVNEDSKYGKAIDFFGEWVVRLPGRALYAEDAFFKTLGYNAELEALATRRALQEKEAGTLGTMSAGQRTAELMRNPPKDIQEAALYNARYVTFTKQLDKYGRGLQNATSHPIGRLFLPFIRTPVNIVKFSAERTPLGLFSGKVRDELKKGGAARDIMLAKMTMSSSIGAYLLSLNLDGNLVGGAPADPEAAATFYNAGKEPYSVRVGDKYYSFARFEPIGTLLGAVADFNQIAGYATEEEREKIGANIVASLTNNFINKTYMSSLSDMTLAMQDYDRYGERFLKGLAASVVVPAAVNQMSREADPHLKDARTLIDTIRSRTPWGRADIPNRHNVWGQVIAFEGGLGPDMLSTIYVSTKSTEKLFHDLERDKIHIKMPDKKFAGKELSPEEYQQFVVNAGKPALNTLSKMAHDPRWDKMPRMAREQVVRKVVDGYRRAAQAQLYQRHMPDVVKDKLKGLN